jgi:NhaP-type Na+/H+ or K+/H+ antiporter
MNASWWYLVVGGLFFLLAITGSLVKRLPLSTSIVYVSAGVALGLGGFASISWRRDASWLEHVTEVAMLVSLFTAGLKLRLGLDHGRWRVPLRLATLAMLLTVLMVALLGHLVLGLSVAGAVLLGAIVAPTDPVLAADVQVQHGFDHDRLRFGLTAEAGLNDATAYPIATLAFLLATSGGAPEPGALGGWLARSCWEVVLGLAVGYGLGTGASRLTLFVRRRFGEGTGYDDFLAIGLVAGTFGIASLVGGLAFLAVFAAGLAMRTVERHQTGASSQEQIEQLAHDAPPEHAAVDSTRAPAFMAEAVQDFNSRLERLAEVGVMLLVGVMLASVEVEGRVLLVVAVILFVVRPLAVYLSLVGAGLKPVQQRLTAWFGMRGVGSVYYLAFAVSRGFPEPQLRAINAIVLPLVAASVILHGFSVTPLMNRYQRRVAAPPTSRPWPT